MQEKTVRSPVLCIAFISGAALSYEVLLIRLFSIIQWHHFAYMVISLALLGYGASGAFLALFKKRLLETFSVSLIVNLAGFGVSSIVCYLFAQRIPFNPEEMLWDLRQLFRLPLLYLLLGLPFFFAASGVVLTLNRFSQNASRTYAADLIGAGMGSLVIIGSLYLMFPMSALKTISFTGFLAAATAWWELRMKSKLALAGILSAGVAVLMVPGKWVELSISPYKGLPQLMHISGTRILKEKSGPLGLITVVESAKIPLRSAPGLSLTARTEPPPQLAVFTDSDAMTVITRFSGNADQIAYLDQLTSALPYHLRSMQSVLILGAGGGSSVLQARYHAVPNIDAVELNQQIVALLQKDYAGFAGNIYNHSNTRVYIDEARGFVRTRQNSYDLIQLSVPGSFGASSAGLYALNENYLFTLEALQDYMNRLTPDGFLAITAWIKMPPRDTFKLFATAVDAVKRAGRSDPERRFILIRGWQTSTLLLKNGFISANEIVALRDFCRDRSFDLAYYPGMQSGESNHYNLLQQPTLFYDAAITLLSNKSKTYLRDYKFNIQPATDNRPYFFHFFKWRVLPEIIGLYRQGGVSLLESGYLLLLAAFVQAAFFSFILILLPLWKYQRTTNPDVSRLRVFSYFFILGLAFLFIEIAFIQKFMLFLYHPIYAVAVSLTAFLLFAGLGSGYSEKLRGRFGVIATVKIAVIAIVALGALQIAGLSKIFELLSGTSYISRMIATVLLIAPLGFFMGMPFPLGLFALKSHSESWIPWAWGVNGCASVLSAILATLIAIEFGFTVLVALALFLYGTAVFVFPAR